MNRKEELQMAILEKIRSHTIPKYDHNDLLFANLCEIFKKLDLIRQLRVHRKFVEILEEECVQQQLEATGNYDDA